MYSVKEYDDDHKAILNSVVGMTETQADAFAEDKGYYIRIVERDGEHYIITMDLRMDRINVKITDGLIVEAHIY